MYGVFEGCISSCNISSQKLLRSYGRGPKSSFSFNSCKHVCAPGYPGSPPLHQPSTNCINSVPLPVPNTVYLVPDFITEEEEQYLAKRIYDSPKPRWTQLANRRLQSWGGHPHAKGMIAEDLPTWLEFYAKKIASTGLFADKKPNHVLVNEYLSGQGIMPHLDGPVFYPIITTLNLNSHTVLDFYKSSASSFQEASFADIVDGQLAERSVATDLSSLYAFSLLLPRRSLLVIKDDMYSQYLHGIKETTEDVVGERVMNYEEAGLKTGEILRRNTRVSVTLRLSQKTSKFKLNLSKK